MVGEKISGLPTSSHISDRIESRESLADIYNNVDILLFPSLAENMPLTVLEAMSCGVITVTTPIGGLPEIIVNGKTGFISNSIEKDDFQSAFRNAINQEGIKVSELASDYIRKFHSLEQMVESYKKLYNHTLTI